MEREGAEEIDGCVDREGKTDKDGWIEADGSDAIRRRN
jgi:hypothetical protein